MSDEDIPPLKYSHKKVDFENEDHRLVGDIKVVVLFKKIIL